MLTSLGIEPIMPPKSDTPVAATPTNPARQTAKVLYTYTTEKDDELNVAEGDEVEILEAESPGWTKARNVKTGATGLIPTNYINVIAAPPVSSGPAPTSVTAIYGIFE